MPDTILVVTIKDYVSVAVAFAFIAAVAWYAVRDWIARRKKAAK